MDSAQFAIDDDNDFYLEHIPVIDTLLEMGLTLFVDKDFPKYNDMTLIQYATAKRKSKTLKKMLERVIEMEIDLNAIIFPDITNTRESLLDLAVEFGSKGFYDTEDNTCLNITIEMLNIKNSDNNKYLNNALIRAISLQNNAIIEFLIQKGVNFFDPLDDETNEITDETIFSKTPIMTLFRLYNDKDKLKDIFDNCLKDIGKSIIERLFKLKINNSNIIQYLNNLIEVKSFISEYATNNNISIPIFDDEQEEEEEETDDQHDDQTDNQTDDQTDNQTDDQTDKNPTPKNEKCFLASCNEHSVERCPYCQHWFCIDHISHELHTTT